jgi:hypothetical protein
LGEAFLGAFDSFGIDVKKKELILTFPDKKARYQGSQACQAWQRRNSHLPFRSDMTEIVRSEGVVSYAGKKKAEQFADLLNAVDVGADLTYHAKAPKNGRFVIEIIGAGDGSVQGIVQLDEIGR